MKRWIVVILVALAVIVMISPGIVGKLAEKNLKNSIGRAERENGDLVVTEERFQRGWFTAVGRHRIELREGILDSPLAELADAADPDRRAALIVDTRIDHGLLPVSSMSRDSGSLRPALATTVSTFHLDTGSGRVIELPGRLFSTIDLSGDTESRYLLEAGRYRGEDLDVKWDGADIRFAIDAGAAALRYDGDIEPVTLRGADGTSTLASARFEGQQQKTAYGLAIGKIALDMRAASFAQQIGGAGGFRRLRLDARNELVGERVNGSSSLDLEALSVPGLGEVDLALDLVVNRLDAAGLKRIIDRLEALRAAAGRDAALPAAYPGIETELAALLGDGGELRVDRFHLSLPQGDVTATMQFDLPQTADGDADFAWPAALLALRASADVRVPATLVEALQQSNPQANTLVAMGILKRDGDAYVVKAEYAKGLVIVNGAPMPIPLRPFSGRTSATY